MIKDSTSNSLAGLTPRRALQYSHPSRISSQAVAVLELSPTNEGEAFFSAGLLWNEPPCAAAARFHCSLSWQMVQSG